MRSHSIAGDGSIAAVIACQLNTPPLQGVGFHAPFAIEVRLSPGA